MSLPTVTFVHSSPGRIRMRAPGRKGDVAYFASLAQGLSTVEGVELVEANPMTAGVLVTGGGISESALVDYGRKEGLFLVESKRPLVRTPARAVVDPLRRLNDEVLSFTHGEVDLATLGFLGLVGAGIYQIARGNLSPLPWYSAFWYAFGLFSKELLNSCKDTPS